MKLVSADGHECDLSGYIQTVLYRCMVAESVSYSEAQLRAAETDDMHLAQRCSELSAKCRSVYEFLKVNS